jgi:hypothetical protein
MTANFSVLLINNFLKLVFISKSIESNFFFPKLQLLKTSLEKILALTFKKLYNTLGSLVALLVLSLPMTTWVWILELNPLSAFHLGLLQPWLYMHIPLILHRKV